MAAGQVLSLRLPILSNRPILAKMGASGMASGAAELPREDSGFECEYRRWEAGEVQSGLHSAPYVFVLRRGRMRSRGLGGDVVLKPGGIFWWPTGHGLGLQAGQTAVEGYILRFRRSGFAVHLSADARALAVCSDCDRLALIGSPLLPLRAACRSRLLELAVALEPWWRCRTVGRSLQLKAGAMQALALLDRDEGLSAARSGLPTMRGDLRVEELLGWLDEHIDEELDIASLAERVGLGRSRFCQVFRRHVGRSVQAHIRRLRVARACRLLSGTQHDVIQAGYAAGFGSPARFHAAFKEVLGTSPARWRREHT